MKKIKKIIAIRKDTKLNFKSPEYLLSYHKKYFQINNKIPI